MRERVAIIGVGCSEIRSTTPGVSYKELMFEAAVKAYRDAGVDPRRDIDSFVTVAEDFWEGTSIFDEYVPDQLGAVMRPVQTIAGDGLQGLIAASLQVLTGAIDVVAIEAHSKASNLLTLPSVVHFATDPTFARPLEAHPYFIAGLEMNRYLHETGTTKEQCAWVVVKNRRNALDNPFAGYGALLQMEDVLNAEPLFAPLGLIEVAQPADGCLVVVLASEEAAKRLSETPIWIEGFGWSTDSPTLETRDWGGATYARLAAEMAYKMAGIRSPRREIDFAEVDDTFAYKELQHLEAVRLAKRGEAGSMTEEGATERDGVLPVNPSGGSLGVGHLLDASSLHRVVEAVRQLRGEAGRLQLKKAEVALVQSWRGVPTTSGAVVILSNRER